MSAALQESAQNDDDSDGSSFLSNDCSTVSMVLPSNRADLVAQHHVAISRRITAGSSESSNGGGGDEAMNDYGPPSTWQYQYQHATNTSSSPSGDAIQYTEASLLERERLEQIAAAAKEKQGDEGDDFTHDATQCCRSFYRAFLRLCCCCCREPKKYYT